MTKPKYPKVKVRINIAGPQGNAFAVLGLCANAARDAGVSEEEITLFLSEAKSGSYEFLIATCEAWFNFKGNRK